jgi:hypothetical protein
MSLCRLPKDFHSPYYFNASSKPSYWNRRRGGSSNSSSTSNSCRKQSRWTTTFRRGTVLEQRFAHVDSVSQSKKSLGLSKFGACANEWNPTSSGRVSVHEQQSFAWPPPRRISRPKSIRPNYGVVPQRYATHIPSYRVWSSIDSRTSCEHGTASTR